MKAQPGIVFSESNVVRDRGISYMDDITKKARVASNNGEDVKLRITRGEYARQFGSTALDVFGSRMGETRAQSVLANTRQLHARTPVDQTHELTLGQTTPVLSQLNKTGRINLQGIHSPNERSILKAPQTAGSGFSARETARRTERSQMRVRSVLGQRDLLDDSVLAGLQTTLPTPGGGQNSVRFHDTGVGFFSVRNRQQRDKPRHLLPIQNVSVKRDDGLSTRRKSHRDASSTADASRVISQKATLDERQEQVTKFLHQRRPSPLRNELEISRTPMGQQHREFLATVSVDETDNVPIYYKHQMSGRVKSQMGDRAKYTRLMKKMKEQRNSTKPESDELTLRSVLKQRRQTELY